ncbi:MAG TPA: ATP-binding cassette domain-containing protein, partial [Gaiellaceae bacterium]|nr:ATP-binding cassette domain-containing protein [Gaiellaceae bacterium]
VLVAILVALGASVLVAASVGVARDRLYARVTASVVADVRTSMFDHLQRLSLGFFSRSQLGDLLARFSGDLRAVEGALERVLAWAVAPALDVTVYSVLLFVLDWRLGLGAMLVWPIALLGPRRFAPKAVTTSYEKSQLEAATLTVVQENLSGLAVVKAFGLEPLWRRRFDRRNENLRGKTASASFVGSLVERSSISGVYALYVAVVAVGAWLVFRGSLSIGKLVAFQALFLALGYGLTYVTQYIPSLVQGLGGFRRIGELFAEEPDVVDRPDAASLPRLGREIALRDVTFSYGDGAPSLLGLNMTIPAGESVAFVGSSGSGKSTALSLIMRFHDPSNGSVEFDGHDIRAASQESLRAQMGVVFQESILFNDSIRENIRMGRPEASDDDVERAARAAEIHDVVLGQPNGYDTVVGERGGLLSGGQRQRISIARAMVRDPAILVLDEATSALDPATEAAINETLAQVAKGRTTISVTHRLASAKSADRIFVLDKGALAESGTHDELVAAGGVYAGLWRRQAGFTLTDDGAEVTAERLAQVPILSALDQELLEDMTKLFATERLPADRIVIQEGDPGDRFYLVVRGRVVVTRRDEDGDDVQVNVHEDGDHFGEIALLRRAPRIATVRTVIPTMFLTLAQDQFLHLIDRAPQVRATMEERIDRYLAEWAASSD